MKNKQLWILSFVALPFLIAACSASNVQPLTENFQNNEIGFSIDLPEGWATQGAFGSILAAPNEQLLAQAQSEDNTLASPVVFVVIQPLAEELRTDLEARGIINAQEMLKLAQERPLFDEGTLTYSEFNDVQIDGQPAASSHISGTTDQSGQPVGGRMIALLGNGHFGTIMSIAPQNEWNDFKDTFAAIVDSIKLFTPNQ